jgi:hypothetical protein
MRKMNVIVMTLAGLLLIVASVLKFQEMLSTCVPAWATQVSVLMSKADGAMPLWKANLLGFWESYEFFLIQIPLEFALGVWLVSGLFRKAAWIAGMLAYFGFILVTLAKALLGFKSCGCFGRVEVDPWMTLWAVDVPFFLLLAIFRPKGLKLLPPPWPKVGYLLAVAAPTIILMVLAAPAMISFRPECLKPQDQRPDPSAQLKLQNYQLKQQLQKQTEQADTREQHYQTQLQTLEQQKEQIQTLRQQVEQLQQAAAQPVEPEVAESPVEKQPDESIKITEPNQPAEPVQQTADAGEQAPAVNQWEWLGYVVEDDVRQQLSRGLVVILMYHHDCSDCAVMVPKYDAYYNEMRQQGNDAFKIAFLAIPPYGQTGPVPEDTACIHGKLTTERKWELTSPYVVVLLDGEVMKTWPQGTAPQPENILDEL